MAKKSPVTKTNSTKNEHNHENDEDHSDHDHNHNHSSHQTATGSHGELQSKYYEYQMIGEQIKQLANQAQIIDEQIKELEMAQLALDELSKSKPGKEILVPISQGMYVKAELKDSESLIMGVGANVMVAKSIKDAVAMTAERLEAAKYYRKETETNQAELMKVAQELELEIQAMMAKLKGQ